MILAGRCSISGKPTSASAWAQYPDIRPLHFTFTEGCMDLTTLKPWLTIDHSMSISDGLAWTHDKSLNVFYMRGDIYFWATVDSDKFDTVKIRPHCSISWNPVDYVRVSHDQFVIRQAELIEVSLIRSGEDSFFGRTWARILKR